MVQNFSNRFKCSKCYLRFSLIVFLFISLSGRADNGVMMQYFHWYLPSDGTLWTQVKQESQNLADAGITALWLPPPYKGEAGKLDVGYGVYDMYDLGEFNQKGSVRTKYGNKADYLDAVSAAHAENMQVYGDVVFNHRGGADGTESVNAVRVERGNRDNQFGGNVQIDAWTRFDFAGRGNIYSNFKWRWYHFDGVDWAQNLQESNIFKFQNDGKSWDWVVDTENGNYDYLIYADVDMEHPEVVQELQDWGEWFLSETQVDGFRIDAVKHIKYDFFNGWLDHLRSTTGQDLFTVGEFWSYDKQKLHNYIASTGGRMSLFDAPLHLNFHQASNSGGSYDMRGILDNTLMKENPALAVTLVDNHDTQPCQALVSPVEDWFKPLAYAIILLRAEGYPNVFYADYYGATYTTSDTGCSDTTVNLQSHKDSIDTLLDARKKYAYGPQLDYLDNWDVIGWTRLGDAAHPRAMAVILSDGPGGSKWMNVERINKTFIDLSGNRADTVTSNASGWAEFPVNGGSHSVWVEESTNPPPLGGEVVVNFSCTNATTFWGQNVYVVGGTNELGNWNPANSVKLDASDYPTWTGTAQLPQNTSIEWKCIKKAGSSVVWQSGGNNTLVTTTLATANSSGSF